jgi:hypothetical protein
MDGERTPAAKAEEDEILPPLPETVAEIEIATDGVFRYVSYIMPKRIDFNALVEESVNRHNMPRLIARDQNHYSQGNGPFFGTDACRINEGGKEGMMEARVQSATTYITQCGDLRDAFSQRVRFVAYLSDWWLPSALGWVYDCREFIGTYGVHNTPKDLMEAFDAIETRLFRSTTFGLEQVDYASPTGAYVVLFGSLLPKPASFSFKHCTYCYCGRSECTSTKEYHNAVELMHVIEPRTPFLRRIQAVNYLRDAMSKNAPAKASEKEKSRPWRATSETGLGASLDVLFGKAGTHIAHWGKGNYAHALVVGPLERDHFADTTLYLNEIGLEDAYVFVRNDITERRLKTFWPA